MKIFRRCAKPDCLKEFEVVSTKSRAILCPKCKAENEKPLPNLKKSSIFGYRGVASDGHNFHSLYEESVEEWLIFSNIAHVPHPRIGASPKHGDQFVPSKDIYLEIDGMDNKERKTNTDWYGKLELYEKLNLKMKIVRFKTTFFENKEQCFKELDQILGFLKETK